MTEKPLHHQRERMVDNQLSKRNIYDERVLDAMRRVPRHRFFDPAMQHLAYLDDPMPIGEKQTAAKPYIVALSTQMLALRGSERVLEIGTGSGYHTAILCELSTYVYSIECREGIASQAADTLHALHYNNLDLHFGDGSRGLPDMAPFDAILVSAAVPQVPLPFYSQMADGARLVIPVGDAYEQSLCVVTRHRNHFYTEHLIAVHFMPMLGKYGY